MFAVESPALVTMRNAALVALGGALGGPARYAVEAALPAAEGAVPWATLAVNVGGAFALGVVVANRARALPALGLAVGTGFLGAFTTFSTWMLQVFELAVDGHLPRACAYVAGTLLAGLAAAAAGTALGRTGSPARPAADPGERAP